MRKKRKQGIARILAFILTFVTVFQTAATDVHAVSANDLLEMMTGAGEGQTVSGSDLTGQNALTTPVGNFSAAASDVVWQMQSAATHGSGHPHQGDRAFYSICDQDTTIAGEDFSVKFVSQSSKADSRGGFMNKYVNDTEYSFIGWDQTNWFVQTSTPGTTVTQRFESLAGITVPDQNDVFTVSGHWNADGKLVVKVQNETKGLEQEATVQHEFVNGLKDKAGRFGFRAATYGAALTGFLFSNVTIGGQIYAGGWSSLYEAKEGQVLAPVIPAAEPKMWHMKATDKYGNGDLNGTGTLAFYAIDQESSITDESFSVTFMSELGQNRFAFINKYISKDSWSYIAFHNGAWYVQFASGWAPISGIPLPKAYDMVTMAGEWKDDGLHLTVTIDNGIDTPVVSDVLIDNAEFCAYKSLEGSVGFRAGSYGTIQGEAYIKSMTLGGQVWTGDLSVLESEGGPQGGMLETVDALPENPALSVGKIWHIKSSENHENGDFGSQKPAFFVADEKSSITDEDFTATFMPVLETNRFAFMNKYIDNDNWSYIGYNTANWYVQWAGTGQNWHDISISDIPLPEPYDLVTVAGKWMDGGLELTVTIDNGTDNPAEYKTVVNDSAFVDYKAQTGKIGFRAAGYPNAGGIDITEAYIKSVAIGGKTWTGSLTSVGDAKGGVVEVVDALPNRPITGDGKMWYYLEGGPNNGGGHAYDNPNAAAPVAVIDKDRKMPLNGSLSLHIITDEIEPNFGIFYSYLDNDNWLYIGYDKSSGWYYQYSNDGKGKYPAIKGLPAPPQGEEISLVISVTNEAVSLEVDGEVVNTPDQAVKNLMEKINGQGYAGVKTNGKNNPLEFTDFTIGTTNCMNDNWGYLAERQGQIFRPFFKKLVNVSGKVTDAVTHEPLADAVVRIGMQQTVTNAEGEYIFEKTGDVDNRVQEGKYNTSAAVQGYVSKTGRLIVGQENMTGQDYELLAKGSINLKDFHYIASDDMRVYVAKNFPRVLKYTTPDGKDELFTGWENDVTTMEINGTVVTPVVDVQENFTDGASSILYTLTVKDESASLDFSMDVKVSVEGKNLTWEITRLDKNEGCAKLGTIDVPDLYLLTIDAYSDNAEFMGAGRSTDTTRKADKRITFDDGFIPGKREGFLYAFVSGGGNGKYSGGLFSNSEAEGDKRVIRFNGPDTISLKSAPWYYELGDKAGQEYKTASQGYPVSELPFVKIALADDVNGDSKVDWQDGAIAFRSIMNTPMGSEQIKDIVNYRIVMNFASMAPNPYLETADNVKKVYLATDGLSQAIMLKGYGNEGHDSANSEYADIAERQGGIDDFKKLIEISHQYNTEVGIHVNAQEVYPEAASFSEAMIGKNTTGISGGWGWLDQSHVIDKHWDLQTRARYKRFIQLFDRINGTSFYSKAWDVNDKSSAVGDSTGEITASMDEIRAYADAHADVNMDFIYLDVWYQDAWETRRIAEEINSLGWRFSTEFSEEGEYDSTWQHWSTDAAYGGAPKKGYNSDVIRFIRNHQRDSQVLNYPEFGGTADNPLLGGYRLRGFEGWGGDQNFEDYIFYTFKDNLPTKFLQHYEVYNWVNYGEDEKCPTENLEKEITLRNGSDVVKVTRVEAQRNDDEIERIITLNGRVVLETTTEHSYYLLPWTDEDGVSQKFYHFNLDGGHSTWQLSDDYKNTTLYVYELTDQGRVDGKAVSVGNDGVLALDAEAGVPYVIVKTQDVKTIKADYGEGDYVADPGFNGYAEGDKLDAAEWSGDLNSFLISRGSRGDQYVYVEDADREVMASTTVKGLTPGKDYVAEIYVDNRSNAKAILEIRNGSEVLSNYTEKSVAQNFVKCDEQHRNDMEASYMQHIMVPFKAAGTEAKFVLKREAGEGITMWDDIRIVETMIDNYKEDGSFVQDFERVVQGIYPFVLGGAEGVADPHTHLSERNGEFTQSGWNGRVLDDVLEGNWSLKTHGSDGGYSGIVYQTIPQNFRFEEGKIYTVGLDYQVYRDNVYAMVVGNGEQYSIPGDLIKATGNTTTHMEFQVMGSEGGLTWIGLYSNGGNSGEGQSMGQRDFILDNLKIAEDKETVVIYGMDGKTDLYVGETLQLKATNTAKADWASDNEKVVAVDGNGLIKAVGKGSAKVTVTNDAGKSADITIKVTDGWLTEVKPADATANTYQGGSGDPENAVDGNTQTVWHSAWSGFDVAEGNKAVITVDFGEEIDLAGFYYLNRPSGTNGIIQKYQWAAGSQFDEATHKITDAELSGAIEPGNQAEGGRNEVVFETPVKARYLQIAVSQGVGKYASIAELGGLMEEKVATDVEMDVPVTEVIAGKSVTLAVKGTDGTVLLDPVWRSSDETIATVDADGVVTFLRTGAVTITFSTRNGISKSVVLTGVKAPDKSYLQDTYDYALTLGTEGVAESAVKFFEKAKEYAFDILQNPDATKDEIEFAWDQLVEGICGLGIYQGDKDTLRILINKAESMKANKDKYVSENWPELEAALTAANEMMLNGDALESDIRPVADRLNKAITIQRYKADKSILEELIKKAGTVNEALYTEESLSLFRTALKVANDMMDDKNLSEDHQSEVDAAAENLKSAIAQLELKEGAKKADTSKLEEQVKKAESVLGSMDESKYTEESLKQFKDVLKAAKDLLASGNLTADDQEKIDQLTKELQDAIKQLRLKDEGGKEEDPSGGDDGNGADNGSSNDGNGTGTDDGSQMVSPKTGDHNALAAGIIVLIVGAALVYLAIRQIKKKKHE